MPMAARSTFRRLLGALLLAWCFAAPVSAAEFCEGEATARSVNGAKVTILLTNGTNERISVLWIDYAGKRVPYSALGRNASVKIETFVGHPWVFVDAAGNCRRMFTPTATTRGFTVR